MNGSVLVGTSAMSTLMAPSLVLDVPWWRLKVSFMQESASMFKLVLFPDPPPSVEGGSGDETMFKLGLCAYYFLYAAGYILTDWPHTQFFTPGETVSLRVNISTLSFASLVAQLAWFHNGREVTTNYGRITVNARGTELTIRNATSSDGGRYTVRTSALSFNTSEDPLWIPLLEHYTPLAPVTYTLTEQGKLLLNSVPRLSSMPCRGSKSQLVHVYVSIMYM